MEPLQVGQRVLYGDFGEGTIVRMGLEPNQVLVAFSEVETLVLPTYSLNLIPNENY
jgi:hypothetical protein